MSSELTPKTGQFDEIISIIDNARTRALKAVNAELIQMYWNVGEYLSAKDYRILLRYRQKHPGNAEIERRINKLEREIHITFFQS